METTYVFDVNETLLDSGSLDPLFEAAFGEGAAMRGRWFRMLLARAWACTIAGEYRPFPELAETALDALARAEGKAFIAQRDEILHRFSRMPAHTDAAPALAHLKKQGARVYALTNSPRAQAEEALEAAQLRDLFNEVISVETLRVFKPDPRVYEMAARAAHDVPSKMWLISSHWWDCMGASRQGWKTALVAREPRSTEPAFVRPAEQADSLSAIVQRIAPTESPVP